MKNSLLVFVIIFIGNAAIAQVKNNIAKATVTFKIKNMGIQTGGSFGSTQGSVDFNPANPADSKIEASIDAASINTENDMRDSHLKNQDYFDVTKYPKITMRSLSIKKNGGNTYIGTFNLTIKDKTKQVTVPFTYSESAASGLFKGHFKINRRDFGVGGNSMVLADEATISIDAEVAK